MKKFFQTISHIFSIEDLRLRIINTLGFLVIFRLGSFVVLPGVDSSRLVRKSEGILGLLDNFLGGAFSNASIFALGIMPYISASIVLQLLGVTIPYLQRLQKEGDSGRKKIDQLTRILTILICLVQGFSYVSAAISPEAISDNSIFFKLSSVIILTAGTVFCMWLGEKITDKGLGNGVSILIMVGIISRFPGSLLSEMYSKGMSQSLLFLFEIAALFLVVVATVALVMAVRRIPVQYAKQVVGNRTYGGQRQYLPIKLNGAGVMPIIFAQSIMFLPSMIAGFWRDKSDFALSVGNVFSDFTSWQYNLTFAILIIVFTFFYTAMTINPNQIGDDLKRNGGFIPGVKPGLPTSEFIDHVLSKITLPGALFLAVIAILPAFASLAGVSSGFAQFYGGTSLLIMVGVILDTLDKINTSLLSRHYEGMMKSGKIKNRTKAA